MAILNVKTAVLNVKAAVLHVKVDWFSTAGVETKADQYLSVC